MRVFELVNRQTGEVTFAGVSAVRGRRCPVCNHDTWCLIDAGRGLVICPRTYSPRQVGDAGYLHSMDGKLPDAMDRIHRESKPRPQPSIDAAAIMATLTEDTDEAKVFALAGMLGVSFASLDRLDVAWHGAQCAWAFPMSDAHRRPVGIRLRSADGRKWAIAGSRNGLFYPELHGKGPVLLPEGPTDTAAALALGFDAIGRPFCRGGMESLCEVFHGLRRPAIVVADQDKAGIDGAAALADALFGIVPVKVIQPPPNHKDLRAWVIAGAKRSSVEFRIEAAELHQRSAT